MTWQVVSGEGADEAERGGVFGGPVGGEGEGGGGGSGETASGER